jgi:hypothetical protein
MPRGTSVYDEAKLQRRLWTPLTLRSAEALSGLAFFIEAFDKSTHQAASGEWTGIRDKSGRGKNMSVLTGGMVYTNNNPFMSFNGTSDGMLANDVGDINNNFPDEISGSLLVTASYTSGVIIFKFETMTGNANSRFGVEGSSRTDCWNDGAGILQFWDEAWSSSVLKVGYMRRTATTLTANLSGKQVATHANTTTPSDLGGNNFISLGYDKLSFNYGNCTIAHAILVSQSDTMTQQRLEGYAAHSLRYEGNYLRAPLVGSHPFVNRPPLLGT